MALRLTIQPQFPGAGSCLPAVSVNLRRSPEGGPGMPHQHPDDARQTEVVFLPRVIDMISADGMRAKLTAAVHAGAAVVLVDLSGTISVDCEGAYCLAQAHRDAVAEGVELRLVAPSPAVLRMLAPLG